MFDKDLILDEFNNLNSKLIQYWWYWFSSILVGGVLLINAVVELALYNSAEIWSASESECVRVFWEISIIAVIIILAISALLYVLQKLFPSKQSLFSHPLIILQQKRLSILIILLNLISLSVITVSIIGICIVKN